MRRNRDELDRLLKQASVRALSQMGLTVAQIAQYFSIDPVEVQALLSNSKSYNTD